MKKLRLRGVKSIALHPEACAWAASHCAWGCPPDVERRLSPHYPSALNFSAIPAGGGVEASEAVVSEGSEKLSARRDNKARSPPASTVERIKVHCWKDSF